MKQLAASRKHANAAIKKSEKAFTAMHLVMANPFFSDLPSTARVGFEAMYYEIKEIRDRADTCITTGTILDFAFDEAPLKRKCALGLKAESCVRSMLGQLALAIGGVRHVGPPSSASLGPRTDENSNATVSVR